MTRSNGASAKDDMLDKAQLILAEWIRRGAAGMLLCFLMLLRGERNRNERELSTEVSFCLDLLCTSHER